MPLRFFLLKLTGKVPATEKLEQLRKQLNNDFELYSATEKSDELKRYMELDEIVNSEKFKAEKKKIARLKYKGSKEHIKEKKYLRLKKHKKLQVYLNVNNSSDYNRYMQFQSSDILCRYTDLKHFVSTDAFKKSKKKKDFKSSEAFESYKELESLKKNPEIVFYYQFQKSKAFKTYTKIAESDLPEQWEKLKTEVSSAEFQEQKEFLNNKNRFTLTEQYKQEQEFTELAKSKGIQTYLKYQNSNKFNEFRNFEVVLDEHFSSLNSEKWNTTHVATKDSFNASFSQFNDLQAYTTNNIETNQGLTLSVRKEEVEGIQLTQQLGFVKNSFQYSSGQINSANKVEFTDGIIEAKVNLNAVGGISQAVYLSSLTGKPHIELIGADKKLRALLHNGQTPNRLAMPGWFANEWAIYRLQKQGNQLTWSINGVELYSEKQVTNQPLFINIGASVQKEITVANTQLKVAWLRVLSPKQ